MFTGRHRGRGGGVGGRFGSWRDIVVTVLLSWCGVVQRIRVVVLVVGVRVRVRDGAGRLVRQRVPVGGPISVPPVWTEGPGLVRGPGVRQGQRLGQVPGGGGVATRQAQFACSPRLATTTSLHWFNVRSHTSLDWRFDITQHSALLSSALSHCPPLTGPACRPATGGERERERELTLRL